MKSYTPEFAVERWDKSGWTVFYFPNGKGQLEHYYMRVHDKPFFDRRPLDDRIMDAGRQLIELAEDEASLKASIKSKTIELTAMLNGLLV